ncbi:AAA family ATPase [Kribbella sp. NPDC055110]
MWFTVTPPRQYAQIRPNECILVSDNWDDYKYKTQFYLVYDDSQGQRHEIGQVKIGRFGMNENDPRPLIPSRFSDLSPDFFSVGQDASYYETIDELGDIGQEIMAALNDIAADESLFGRALDEDVTGISLLRSVTRATVEGQFKRLATGGARLSPYYFRFTMPPVGDGRPWGPTLSFNVEPNSDPPTNIHVLVGRNGVGKTRLLECMTRAAVDAESRVTEVGYFSSEGVARKNPFANLVSVSFSAFDLFEPLPSHRNKSGGMDYVYVGLKPVRTTNDDKALPPKAPTALAREFGLSLRVCLQGARKPRWRRALQILESDPIFSDADVSSLAEQAIDDEDELRVRGRELYKSLSSGHKIVLLTITKLIEHVDEGSLVLLDEPEAHLHPPLLSAFIRALSDLLINRNGAAIVATHSPVVLQEVPRTCVFKLHRSGYQVSVDEPDIETFGENVGTLTREVFGLEVTRSGFHRMLSDLVSQGLSAPEIRQRFGGALGSEAEAIIQAMVVSRRGNS